MLAIKNLLRTNPQIVKNVIQQRNMSVISTPARNKVSTVEMVLLAGAMVIGWTAVPIYVLVNLKHYQNKD